MLRTFRFIVPKHSLVLLVFLLKLFWLPIFWHWAYLLRSFPCVRNKISTFLSLYTGAILWNLILLIWSPKLRPEVLSSRYRSPGLQIYIYICGFYCFNNRIKGRRGHHRILFGFTTTYAIGVITNSDNADVYLTQHYVIKFGSAVWQVCGFILELTATV